MDTKYLDELVQKCKPLDLLTRGTASGFVDKAIAFFREYGSNLDYYRRGIQINPPLSPTPWKDEGKITFLGARFDLDDVYIEIKNRRGEEDSLYANLHTRDAAAGYVFIPNVGLYLHDEVGIHSSDQLLIVSR